MANINKVITQRSQVPLTGLNQQDRLLLLVGNSLMSTIFNCVTECSVAHVHADMKPCHPLALGSAQTGTTLRLDSHHPWSAKLAWWLHARHRVLMPCAKET